MVLLAVGLACLIVGLLAGAAIQRLRQANKTIDRILEQELGRPALPHQDGTAKHAAAGDTVDDIDTGAVPHE
jgi:glucose-6-phosphate-specific signal transduction histidine kinase